jgi:GNAT superfamily N-acetyltransferase
MKINIHHQCTDFDSFRSARIKSLFNVESGANFNLEADLPIEDHQWQIGVVVGASGTGKTSIGQQLGNFYEPIWPENTPIIDAISPGDSVDKVTAALAAVGLGTVPTWLRPYSVLSNGEKFRATMARLICECPDFAVVDEFSSVVDRQIARVGAGAFAKAWRKNSGRVILLSCHDDILEWVQPDWVFNTNTGEFTRGYLWRRPTFTLEIYETGWGYWPLFEPHHYLKMPPMIASTCYVGFVNGQPVCHLGVSTRPGLIEARACRLVVMPEWQGAGVGLKFLNAVCEFWYQGKNRYKKPMPTLFHTSHPGLCHILRNRAEWTQVSAALCGQNKLRCKESINKSAKKGGWRSPNAGFGGHFRAVQGFRYLGQQS